MSVTLVAGASHPGFLCPFSLETPGWQRGCPTNLILEFFGVGNSPSPPSFMEIGREVGRVRAAALSPPFGFPLKAAGFGGQGEYF